MEGYFSKKRLEPGVTLFGDRLVDIIKSVYDERRSMVKICVEGYDTSLPVGAIIKALRNHFESCGEVHKVEIPRERVTNVIKRYSFVYLRGEGAEEKALLLNGSDVGGWNVAVKVEPPPEMEFTSQQLADMRVSHFRRNRRALIYLYGGGTVYLALQLCKSDVGGRKLVAKALPFPKPKKTSFPDEPPGSCFG